MPAAAEQQEDVSCIPKVPIHAAPSTPMNRQFARCLNYRKVCFQIAVSAVDMLEDSGGRALVVQTAVVADSGCGVFVGDGLEWF
jgi:hypothetical protein